eukprot:8507879-Heterocapsa_arctica.AAC.1
MALKVSEGFGRSLSGLRASSLSPLDSSQNADNVAQHMGLRVSLEPQKQCCFDSPLLVQDTLVMYTCSCTLVGPP